VVGPDGSTPSFAWRDGPVLKAIKEGSWILLDEVNKIKYFKRKIAEKILKMAEKNCSGLNGSSVYHRQLQNLITNR
jgi:hypothetical protein